MSLLQNPFFRESKRNWMQYEYEFGARTSLNFASASNVYANTSFLPSLKFGADGPGALEAAHCPGLRPILEGGEARRECDVRDGIAVRVNPKLVQRLRRKWLGGGGFTTADGCTFITRIDLPASPGLGKAYRSVKSRRASPRGNRKSGPE